MLFLVQWRIAPEHRDKANNRFKETGGPPPKGVKMLGRWHLATGGEGLLICEADDAIALGKWTNQWTDVLRFRVSPVNNDEGVMEVLSS